MNQRRPESGQKKPNLLQANKIEKPYPLSKPDSSYGNRATTNSSQQKRQQQPSSTTNQKQEQYYNNKLQMQVGAQSMNSMTQSNSQPTRGSQNQYSGFSNSTGNYTPTMPQAKINEYKPQNQQNNYPAYYTPSFNITPKQSAIESMEPGNLRSRNQMTQQSNILGSSQKEENKYDYTTSYSNSYTANNSISTMSRQSNIVEKKAQKGIVGLRNIGNTCFLNSVLQCLFNSPKFNDAFLEGTYKKDLQQKNKGVATEYSELVRRVREAGNNSIENPSGLKRSIERQSSQFFGSDQQDAQELMINLLEGLNFDLNRVTGKTSYQEMKDDLTNKSLQQLSQEWWDYQKSRENSLVQDFFMGQLLNKVTCQKCLKDSLAFDNFMDLSLSLSRLQSILDDMTITRLLEYFLKEEQLDEYYCTGCKKPQKSKKKFEFWRLPNILVFHIKRFNFRRFTSDKLNNKIIFPIENLDLGPLTDSKDSSVKNSVYDLYGVVNHSGSLYGGHYTADCLSPLDNRWYRFNDSSVHEINITSQGYHTTGGSSPYILFYAKKNLFK